MLSNCAGRRQGRCNLCPPSSPLAVAELEWRRGRGRRGRRGRPDGVSIPDGGPVSRRRSAQGGRDALCRGRPYRRSGGPEVSCSCQRSGPVTRGVTEVTAAAQGTHRTAHSTAQLSTARQAVSTCGRLAEG